MNVVYVAPPLAGQAGFDSAGIAALLCSPRRALAPQGEFSGKPHTVVHADACAVAKVKEFSGHSVVATRNWVDRQRTLELNLGIYPAEKTWFLVERDGRVVPGNVTRRRCSVQQVLAHREVATDPAGLELLARLHDLTLSVAARHGLAIDMGLSNFVLDDDGSLLYVDDDRYDWDRFIGFSNVLASHMRELRPDIQGAGWLGQSLYRSVMQHFAGDGQWLHVIARHLQETFIPAALERSYQALSAGLLGTAAQGEPAGSNPALQGRKVAILGDIHANAPALRAVLRQLARQRVDDAIVVGDIVGYGPHPDECVELIHDSGFRVLKGNHDHAAAIGRVPAGFSRSASWAMEWTLGVISAASVDWLCGLPPRLQGEDFMAVHGAPRDPSCFNAYVYESTYGKNLDYMQQHGIALCFHGHTHIPGAYVRSMAGADTFIECGPLALGPSQPQVLVSPGSVGLPRNKLAAAQYAIWDREVNSIEYFGVDYDIDGVVAHMKQLGFPDFVRVHLERLQGFRQAG